MDIRRRFIMLNKKQLGPGGEDTSGAYVVDLKDNWQLSTRASNPDPSKYEGVYESFSNYNVNNGAAVMTITLNNLDEFTLYIRSYAESYYDYIMVSQLDKTIDGNTSYLYNESVKAHTRTTQNSGTDFYSYTPVSYENIGGGEHIITIVYRKDSSGNSYDDRGYILIGKDYKVYNPDSGGSGEGGENETEQFNPENYMTIEALEDGLSAMLNYSDLQYNVDGGDWISLPAGTYTSTISAGQKLYFKGSGLTPTTNSGIGTFTITKSCNLAGNCNSLLFGDNAEKNFSLAEFPYAYYKLFYNCTAIKSISETFLPAMALSNYCYGYMFYGCTNLVDAPDLPAQTLTSSCYYYMYRGCISLTNPGIISATTLATYCCYGMYYGCTSLTTAPDLLAETMISYCYYYMFSNCSNLNFIRTYAINKTGYYQMYYWMNGVAASGTFYKHPDATWGDTGTSGVPNGWTLKYISIV
jgi:hypothetical protein